MGVFKPCLLLWYAVFLLRVPSTLSISVSTGTKYSQRHGRGQWQHENIPEPLIRREVPHVESAGTVEAMSDHAIVTLVCNNHWVHGALALGASLRAAGTKSEVAIMLSNNVSQAYHSLLAANFDKVFHQNTLAEHPSIWRTNADCLTMQLNVWRLPYKKVLYMDADMIVLRSPDALFENFEEFSARKERKTPEFNGGMFMCQPKEETFVMLREALKTQSADPKIEFSGMQHFLNLMFPPCSRLEQPQVLESGLSLESGHALPGCWRGQFNSSHNRFTRDLSADEAAALMRGELIYDSIHFSGDWEAMKKPWMRGCFMGASSTTRHLGQTKNDIMELWNRAYRKVTLLKDSGDLLKVQCPYFTCKTADMDMDFIIQADKLDCTTRNALNRALKFAKGRRVLLLTAGENCQGFSIPKVECHDQDEVLPEVSQQAVLQWLARKFRETGTRVPGSGQVPTGDQQPDLASLAKILSIQLARMGIAKAARKLKLSDTYVVLESVMLLIRDFCPFNMLGQTNFMESLDDEKDQCQQAHKAFFEQLVGQRYILSNSSKSFAANHMVVNAQAMNKLLEVMQNRSGAAHWSIGVLENACPSLEACRCGFSASGSYASWVHAMQPNAFAVVPARYREFTPYTTEEDAMRVKVSALFALEARDHSDKCCPAAHDFHNANDLGMGHQFVKFSRECEHRTLNDADAQDDKLPR